MTKKSFHSLYNVNGWAFVSVAVGLIALMTVYPIANSLWLSLHSGRGVITEFVGFGNVVRLYNDPIFKTALYNTLVFLVVQVPIMILLSLSISSCLNSPKLRCKQWFRMAIFLPCVTSLVAYSILFKSMFELDGVINSFLMLINVIDQP